MSVSLFGIMNISTGALNAYKDALAVTSNNLSNSQTTGYTREAVDLDAAPSLGVTPGQYGEGVIVANVDRLRDTLLDNTTRQEMGLQSQYQQLSTTGTSLENVFGSPTNPTLNADLDSFFNAYNSLTTSPEDVGVRQTVSSSAQVVASDFNDEANQLSSYSQSLGASVTNAASDINSMLTQVASLNQQIAYGVGSGNNPNTALDQRDNLLDKLSAYMNLTTTQGPNQMINISVNGANLLTGVTVENTGVQVMNDANGNPEVYSTDAVPVALATTGGGQLEGLVQSYQMLDTAQSNLNDLANTFATSVNNLCTTGFDLNGNPGEALFDPQPNNTITAANITVNPDVLNDPTKVVAAAINNSGDSGMALQISQLQNNPMNFATLPASTINQAVTNVVSGLGAATQTATSLYNNYNSNLTTLENQRQAADGVNTDEEVSNMLAYQNSYEAAAKVISSVDLLLQTIIAMPGAAT
jgi:flagellar hook-associated protein 1 FlgK